MGGAMALAIALRRPVRRLVLTTASGGVDVARLGGADWRKDFDRTLPPWFVDARPDITPELARIDVPTLLIWGDADPISPIAVGRFLEQHNAGARLVIIPGGTHALAI
jgi:pimeloyl-ACP methyl ester carboxylesterase